ncbi:cation:dicarboxylase symporter family transporter, partial [Xanthomonas citri pv. citri]|nr:cation:dicarboxylase symporter family transporter [Xanthomonas citri pv. citri]
TLSTAGLPLEGMALLLAVDPIVDMGRTALNVSGQALIPALVASQEGILDRDRYDAPRGDIFGEDEEEIVEARAHATADSRAELVGTPEPRV